MRHPVRELGEFLDGELPDDRRLVLERHLERCARCREIVDGQRHIQERLRSLDVPAPRPDLANRILRESPIASERPYPPAPPAVPAAATGDPSAKSAARRVALTASAVLAGASVLTIAGAYILGGEEELVAGRAPSLASVWSANGIKPASGLIASASLDQDDLRQLRSEGWNCPQFGALGYRLVSATGTTVDGYPAVRIKLTNGTDNIIVVEERRGVEDMAGSELETVSAEKPVNGLTGHTVTQDGFWQVDGMDRQMWVLASDGWTVVLDSKHVTYTVWSDLPVSELPETVNQVVVTEKSRLMLPRTTADNDPISRIVRGLGMMIQPARP
ncbi:anti-sigma factor family protein [Arthrobacter sp. GCM10027362]|uniref:anti-sigma factor family protein n=1 Tax=Arthrobacter sp. GCM10027362 TaxID=3273379 RepID=UPI0036273A15